MPPDEGRFDLLLPLRGVLALTVVLQHIAPVHVGVPAARIVLFLVISGYCIFASAESAVAAAAVKGIGSARSWLVRRVLRIWPPYAIALCYLGVVVWLRDKPIRVLHPEQSPLVWGLNVAILAWTRLVIKPIHAAWHNPDLVVPMHWTLGYEVQFYFVVAMALGLGSLGAGRLRWLALGLGVTGVAAAVVSSGLQLGLITDYGACFAIGAAVFYRGCAGISAVRRGLIDAALGVVLAASLALAVYEAMTVEALPPRGAAGELAVAAGFGIGLILVRPFSAALSRKRWMVPFTLLGQISYSLFLIHPINIPIVNSISGGVLPDGSPRWVVIGARLACHVALAVPFWWACERPLVGLLQQRRARRAAARGVVEEARPMAEGEGGGGGSSAMLPS